MKVLVVGDKKKETIDFFEMVKMVSKEFKDIEVSLIDDENDRSFNFPLLVVNNIIISSGMVLKEEEIREIFNNPSQGCASGCEGCNKCHE